MYNSSGLLNESLKVQHIMVGQTQTSTTALYNGASSSTSGVDTQGYSDALFMLHIAQIDYPATLTAAIYEADTNSSAAAVAITSADFGVFQSDDVGSYTGGVKCNATKRYLFLRTQVSGATCSYTGTALLGQARDYPISNTRNKFSV